MTEALLIERLKQTVLPDAVKHEEFDTYDIYSKQYNMYAELKCLTKHHSTIMIEKIKYDELIKLPNARYIVATPNGCWSWRIDKLKNINWKEMYFENVSTMYHRETQNGYKTVAFLPLAKAKKINIQL
jgi:hypothetical protein